jgi:hypothetical protein
MTNRNYRMYGLVPYNLSPIQQGIQFGHAVVEYGLLYWETPEYQRWAKEDKTFIILNGGTTNSRFSMDDGLPIGSLNNHLLELDKLGVEVTFFHEPDLGDQLTAVVFLVDDRVWDRVAWPDFDGPNFLPNYYEWKMKFADTEEEADRIVWLRSFLGNFKLA